MEANYFDKWIMEELLYLQIINNIENIQMINWFPSPPYNDYTCAIRLSVKITVILNKISNIFEKIDIIDNYINIKVKDAVLSNKVSTYVLQQSDHYGFKYFICDQRIVVEHTSQTPAYPINIGTFRGSVIGNALVSVMKKYNIPVSTHFMVSDTARNIDLILKYYNFEEILSLKTKAKTDHLCGVLFCNALMEINKSLPELNFTKVSEMFPFADRNVFKPSEKKFNNGKISEDNIKSYCNFCLQGQKETLKNAYINIDSYDYETTALKEANYDFFVNPEQAKREMSANKVSYLWLNCAYYSYLTKKNSLIFSVLNSRQEQKINEVLTHLKNNNQYKPIFFEDVIFYENGRNTTDSIKSGRFHSVDEYIRNASQMLNVDCDIIWAAFKLLFLAKKNYHQIILDVITFNDLKKYVKIVNFIKSGLNTLQMTDKITQSDAVLARYLIIAYSIFDFKNIFPYQNYTFFNTYKIVNYIETIMNYVLKEFSHKKINQNVAFATHQVLENALSLLGI